MRSDRLRVAVITLSLLGLAIAAYLTYVHYADIKSVCTISHGCEKVQNSEWSTIAGVPVALLGLAGYAGILVSAFIPGELGLLLGAGQSLIGVGFSAYLTYREIWSIEAICIWCVASAIVLTLLAILCVARLLRAP